MSYPSQSPFRARLLNTLLLASCAGILLAGCGIFKPDEEPPPGGGDGPIILGHPEDVLRALEKAYSTRDSSLYKELYDSTYTGNSVDLNEGGTGIDLVYDDEIRHIRNLVVDPAITAVYLDLGPSWNRQASDDVSHPEWTVIQIVGAAYRVEVYEGQNSFGAIGEAGTFQEFAFTPTLDGSSPTDTLWKIVRWRERGRSEPPPPP